MAAPRVLISELPEQAVPDSTDLLVIQDGPTTKKMLFSTLTSATNAAAAAHISDSFDAHDASAISFVPTGALTATDVQAAIVQASTTGGGGGGGSDLPLGGLVGQVLGKVGPNDGEVAWVEDQVGGGGGGGITTAEAVNAVAASMGAGGNNIDITFDGSNITVAVEPLTKSDVGLANVDNTSDAAKPVSTLQQTAINARVPTTRTLSTTLPLTIAGTTTADLSLNRTLGINQFSTATVAPGVVPGSAGAGANAYLNGTGEWTVPSGGSGGGSTTGHTTFTYNATTSEPPTGDQLRFNNANPTLATRMWVSQTSADGGDVTTTLQKIRAGHQIYVQDYLDVTKWVRYTASGPGTDDGAYFDFTVAHLAGPGGFAAGKVEFIVISPGSTGIPTGGTVGQVLGKTGSADGAVGWVADQVGGGGGGITTSQAVDAVAAAMIAGNNIDITYSGTNITVDVEPLTIGDIADLGTQLSNKADAASTATALSGKQTADPTLSALATFSTTGLMVQTSTDVFAGRTLAGTTNRIDVVNGSGASGNPTIDIGTDVVTAGSTHTLTGKTINLAANTVSGSVAQFNSALGGADFYVTGDADVVVGDGGTGRSTHTAYGLLAGGTTTTNPQQSVAPAASGFLKTTSTTALPAWSAIAQADVTNLTTDLAAKVTNVSGVAGIWTGTQAAYDAITPKVATTLYVIT